MTIKYKKFGIKQLITDESQMLSLFSMLYVTLVKLFSIKQKQYFH